MTKLRQLLIKSEIIRFTEHLDHSDLLDKPVHELTWQELSEIGLLLDPIRNEPLQSEILASLSIKILTNRAMFKGLPTLNQESMKF